ncbi:MAG TPA: hypothetical protein VJ521_13190, partial [Acidobacteriota bacterium]|nr:hypothetical protein [Acidobacteriota bacterium]
MQIAEAKLAVCQILNEECERPTIGYEDIANEWVKKYREMTPEEIAAWKKITSVPRKNLWAKRKENQRTVTETPNIFQFSGTNFELLISAFGRINENERPELIGYILQRIESGGTRTYYKPASYVFPSFVGKVCELPLVAEFCIRTGNIESFFAATAKPTMPTDALAIMMIQLEETIALNWDLFSDEQLGEIPKWLAPLREIAYRQTHSASGPRGGPMVKNLHYIMGHENEANQILNSIDGITKECEQARFWYLKGTLQRTVNLEVESDMARVEGFLTKLGFSSEMIKTLKAAENDFRSNTNPFELKSCLGHIRSFLEHLHRKAAQSIAAAAGDTVVDRWGDATIYLRQQGYFTKQHEAFITALYTLISDASVHPLAAEREYARLLRNVVIEYGLMFLTVLAKRGVSIGK